MYPLREWRGLRSALVLLLLVLIAIILSILIVVLIVLVLVLVVVLISVLVVVLVIVLVLHNEHSFFVICELRTHYAPHQFVLCVFLLLDCHSKWSSKAYRKVANVITDAITIGTLIHQSHGWSN